MYKQFIWVLLLGFGGCIPESNEVQMKANDNVYEIALFRVKDASGYVKLNEESIDKLSILDGYVESKSFQNIEDEEIFMDIVVWSSMEEAKAAQTKFENSDEPAFKSYLSNISEMIFFDHVVNLENGLNQYHESMKGDILEFVLFHIMKGSHSSYSKSRARVMDHLGKTYDGFKEVQTVKSISKPTLLIDLAVWEDASQCHTAQKEIEVHPLFSEFASNFDPEEEVIMQFFRQVR